MAFRGLSSSKHASPQASAQQAPRPVTFSVARANAQAADKTIATKEQIAAADKSVEMTSHNADAQLAVAQNKELKEQMEHHSAKFGSSVSSAVTNTRQLLNLIRDSIKTESPSADADLKAVDSLWLELEKLFEAAQDAKTALPNFMEKQKDNMSLYHNSMVNETMREAQEELNLQHKKVNIQHSLILEHQQAFQDYKAQTESKLNELNDLKERVSRLTLDKGLLRTELDKAAQELNLAKAGKAEDAKKVETLQKEIETVLSSKKELTAESDSLRKTISDLQDKAKAAGQQATDYYEKELRRLNEQYDKEHQKATALEALRKSLQNNDSTIKELEKLKTEFKLLQDKYKNQGAEYSKIFTQQNDQNKKINTLNADLERLQKQNAELNQRLRKMSELEKEVSDSGRVTSELRGQLDKQKREMDDAREATEHAKKEVKNLSDKLKESQNEYDKLETEYNDLLSKQAESKKTSAAFSILKAENTKLLATVEKLQNRPASSRVSDSPDSPAFEKEKKALEDKLREAEATQASMEKAIEEWSEVAKRSYKEYKDILPLYKQADNLRKENDELKAKLSNPTAKSNGVGNSDAAYWKEKYEALVESLN